MPLIVIVLLNQAAVTPVGKPVGNPMPVAPVVVCVIGVNVEFIHKVGVDDGAESVLSGITFTLTEELV